VLRQGPVYESGSAVTVSDTTRGPVGRGDAAGEVGRAEVRPGAGRLGDGDSADWAAEGESLLTGTTGAGVSRAADGRLGVSSPEFSATATRAMTASSARPPPVTTANMRRLGPSGGGSGKPGGSVIWAAG
jgi:hypothetical protein